MRKGNPKGIKDWSDVGREGVSAVAPNPKTGGGARWIYLAAWGAELARTGGDEAKARELVSRIYANMAVLDSGARGSTTTFVERGIGDVLLSWENEALLAAREIGKDAFEIGVPPKSILAEPPVAVVDKVVDRRGTRAVAQAYLEFLGTEEGQRIAAKHYYRPRHLPAGAVSPGAGAALSLFTIDEVFGGWAKAQRTHFDDGALFDQIYAPKAK